MKNAVECRKKLPWLNLKLPCWYFSFGHCYKKLYYKAKKDKILKYMSFCGK